MSRHGVAQGPHPSMRIDQRDVGHRSELPEAAAHEGEPTPADDPDPHQPELGVRAADHHGCSGG